VRTRLEKLIALVDDHLLSRLAMFLPDHHSFITGLTLLDDRGPTLVARTLANCYAGTNRTDANAYAG
jgi:hypothetical protein